MTTKTIRLIVVIPMMLGAYVLINSYAQSNPGLPDAGRELSRFSSGAIVSGSGQLTRPGRDLPVRFQINVVKDRFGQVTGYLKYRDEGRQMQVRLDCLEVDGSVARVSGRTERGRSVGFLLVDGSGGEMVADQISLPQAGAECLGGSDAPLFALSEGAVRIEQR